MVCRRLAANKFCAFSLEPHRSHQCQYCQCSAGESTPLFLPSRPESCQHLVHCRGCTQPWAATEWEDGKKGGEGEAEQSRGCGQDCQAGWGPECQQHPLML